MLRKILLVTRRVKIKKDTDSGLQLANHFHRREKLVEQLHGWWQQTKEKFKVEIPELDGICFDCLGKSSSTNYSDGTKKETKFLGRMYKNGNDIQITILKDLFINIPVTVTPTVGDAEFQEAKKSKMKSECLYWNATLRLNMKSLTTLLLGSVMNKRETNWRRLKSGSLFLTNQMCYD